DDYDRFLLGEPGLRKTYISQAIAKLNRSSDRQTKRISRRTPNNRASEAGITSHEVYEYSRKTPITRLLPVLRIIGKLDKN
ncbi:14389_t:CDS:2, partial [Gigaspora rosea]